VAGLLDGIGLGLAVTLAPANLGYCFLGVLVGTLIGVLPGIGPIATISLLLPVTFGLSPVAAVIMLAGIYYGAQYGGSTTAILVNMPGEAAAVVTCLDGHPLARQGRAGTALGVAAVGSFVAGTLATLGIALLAPVLSGLALAFGAAEYCALMVFGLVLAVVLAQGDLLNALGMIALGLLLGTVGLDVNTGFARFVFGVPELSDGVGFVPLAMGVFGVGEVIANVESPSARELLAARVVAFWPSRAEWRAAGAAILRGTGLGFVLGVLPGGGAVLGSFTSYALEKRVARSPERFGRGALEGVAGPESANNAAAQSSFIPLLTLGLPGNPVMALMLAALVVHGITPGPQVMTRNPDLFWGVIASMWLGNLFLLVLNLPLIGVWVKVLAVPYRVLFPLVLLLTAVGAYSINNAVFDVWLVALFGALGYAFRRLDCEPAPFLLAFVLSPLLEENLRRALLVSSGDATVFVTRPLAATLLLAAALVLATQALPAARRARSRAFTESG
jgi:putative tricarboxylic transport membrane protein